MKELNVLVACEESQAVTIELRQLGVNAFSCDLLECSGGHPEWHIKEDVTPLLNGNVLFMTCDNKAHVIKGQWDMVLAFPPCTYMTKASAVRMYKTKGVIDPVRYSKAIAAKQFFMKIYNAECEHIAIENPVPLKCIELPKHTQYIQPYEYGHPFSKKTCLWLKGLEPLQPTDIIKEYVPFIVSGGGRIAGLYPGIKFTSGACDRSKTFPGIAKAIAEQFTKQLRGNT